MPDNSPWGWTPTVIEGGKAEEENSHEHNFEDLRDTASAIIHMASEWTDMSGECFNCTMNVLVLVWIATMLEAITTLDKDSEDDQEAAERGFQQIETVLDRGREFVEEGRERWKK